MTTSPLDVGPMLSGSLDTLAGMPEAPFDENPDPCEASFTDPRAAGAVYGKPTEVLAELRRRRDDGHSYARIREDFGLHDRVTNGEIDRAARNAPSLIAQDQRSRGGSPVAPGMASRKRYFGGIAPLPTKAEFEARQRASETTGSAQDAS